MSAPFDSGLTVKNKFGKNTPIYPIEDVNRKKLVTHETKYDAEIVRLTALREAEIEPDEDEVNEQLFAQIKANKAKKALREATANIQRYRLERCRVIHTTIDANLLKIKELQKANDEHKRQQDETMSGLHDGHLTSGVVRQAEQIHVAPIAPTRPERPQRAEGEKRVRKVIHRPPLCDLIKSRLNFKWEGKTCYTDNGKEFLEPDGTVFRSLNSWTETIIERTGGGGRKVSVYVVVDVQNNETEEWKKWGEVYTEDCTSLQF